MKIFSIFEKLVKKEAPREKYERLMEELAKIDEKPKPDIECKIKKIREIEKKLGWE